jgi:hypothetical protein
LRTYKGERRYARTFLGLADDGERKADGKLVYDYEQAKAAALKIIDAPAAAIGKYTVADAMSDYIAHKQARGQPVNDLIRRSRVWITPTLGHYAVRELTSEQLNRKLLRSTLNKAGCSIYSTEANYPRVVKESGAVRVKR